MSLIDAFLLDPTPLNIWIAWRSDGVAGSGTHSDPFDASTKLAAADTATSLVPNSDNAREIVITLSSASAYANGDLVVVSGGTGDGAILYNGVFAIYGKSGNTFKFQSAVSGPSPAGTYAVARITALRFDDLMNSLPANCRVHMGPTPAGNPFLTKGFADGVSGGWQPKPGMKIVGSGIDVTVLQLVGATTADKHYYAIGHDLKTTTPAANPMDGLEISELTIDCGLHSQPVASGKTYAPVAMGAVRLMGSHCKIYRVKAINWGTKSATQECFVFDLIAATGDPYVLETVNSGIEDCIAISPSQNSLQPSTAFSIRGVAASAGIQGYGKSPYIRNCFVEGNFRNVGTSDTYFSDTILTAASATISTNDGTFTSKRTHNRYPGEYLQFRAPNAPTCRWNGYFPLTAVNGAAKTLTVDLSSNTSVDAVVAPIVCGAEIRGLAISSCRGGVVEGNQIHNVWFALHVDTYAAMLNAKDVIVRNNYFKNVVSAAFWKAGALPASSLSVTVGTIASGFVPMTAASPHNLFVNAWVGLVNGGSTVFYRVSNVIDATHFEIAATAQPTGSTIRLVQGVDKLLIEGNIIELVDFDSDEYAAPRLDAAGTQPIAVLLSDAAAPGSGTANSFGDVVVRNNKIRYVDGKLLGAPSGNPLFGTGIQTGGAKTLLCQHNVIEVIPANPLQNFRCGSASYFNNKHPNGTLRQGLNGTTNQKYDELETEAEDALVLSSFQERLTMGIQIKSLAKGVLTTSTDPTDVYVVPLNKTAIVKSIRLVNTGGSSATVNLYVRRSTSGTRYRILPKDLSLAPGAMLLDEAEITLEGLATTDGEDRIQALANSGATVDCVISGVERDVA